MSQSIYPWLEPIWQRLVNLTNSKLPHAFLFCGSRGIGIDGLVSSFEKLVLCQSPTSLGACNTCRSCFLFEQGLHPDLRAQTEETTGIDDIRELSGFLEESAHQQGKKVITLFDVDKLQTACANALLKTLEEPPVDAVIILVANKLSILPTIKSRCILVNIPAPPVDIALTWLKQEIPDANEKRLKISLYFAGGAPLLAKMLYENQDVLEAMLDALVAGKASAFDTEHIQQFILSKPLVALYLFYYFLMDYQRFVLTGTAEYLYNENQVNAVHELKKRLSLPSASDFVEKVNEAIQSLAMTGINKSLLFEALFCDWQQLCHQGNK